MWNSHTNLQRVIVYFPFLDSDLSLNPPYGVYILSDVKNTTLDFIV